MKPALHAAETAPATIGELAQRKLRESPYFFLRKLTCTFERGVLTLRGDVPYHQLRQFAEAIVGRVDGVREVDNRVEVRGPFTMPQGAPAVRNAG